MADGPLPVEALRESLWAAGPRPVLTAETGSGKSTQVPRWCAERGPTLVIEPRRVACRSLAAYVAELEGSVLGARVGYEVRDERRRGPETQLLYVTPGIALKMMRADPKLAKWKWVWLDELHERSLQIDLLLALLRKRRRQSWGVMSATIDARRLAHELAGVALHAEGRSFPVETRYLGERHALPHREDLARRVRAAVTMTEAGLGDVLVFLPGRSEIQACAAALRGHPTFDVLSLHGGQTLDVQRRVFAPASRRRVVLATNVAETSLTIEGVRWVIDSGLVRELRWHGQHSSLETAIISDHSAQQRAGRAGRVGSGVCVRLWGEAAQLARSRAPEVQRIGLEGLVLESLAVAEDPRTLPWLDAPAPDAIRRAFDRLRRYGAVDQSGTITGRGEALSALPLTPWRAAILEAASATPWTLEIARMMVAMERGLRPTRQVEHRDGLGELTDPQRLLAAWRLAQPQARAEIDRAVKQVVAVVQRQGSSTVTAQHSDHGLNDTLVELVAQVDPKMIFRRRRRARRVAWTNGEIEVQLGASCGVDPKSTEWIAALALRAVGGRRDGVVLCDCAIATRTKTLANIGVGEVTWGPPVVQGEHLYRERRLELCDAVISQATVLPTGEAAVSGAALAVLDGALQGVDAAELVARVQLASFFLQLVDAGVEAPSAEWQLHPFWSTWRPQSAQRYLLERLVELGFESGRDWALLDASDVMPPSLPDAVNRGLSLRWPQRLEVPGASYRVDYDLSRRRVTLVREDSGRRMDLSPALLPRLPGFAIDLQERGRTLQLRSRR